MRPTPVLAALFALGLGGIAFAQDAPRVSLRGTIETVSSDRLTLNVRTLANEESVVRLKDPHTISAAVAASLADIKPGLFIGVAAMPGPEGALKAMEVHIFPEAARGTGEGFRPFDMGPQSTMTNGAISTKVDSADGPRLTVAYKGGEQTIIVDPTTPIVLLGPGAPEDLKPGVSISVRGATKAADGAYETNRVLVGKDGLKLPI
jgi:Domain of unknown function (DUF5666)